ncbi:fatty-acid-CoA ligase domain protein [Mycobacterium xenopi 3993]|nr:fatty-acid-CoA ligase domain protein [Mycobacterium xenopi 3993]
MSAAAPSPKRHYAPVDLQVFCSTAGSVFIGRGRDSTVGNAAKIGSR